MDFLHPENDPQGIDRYSQYIEYAQNSNHLDNPFQYHFFSSSPILTILKNRASNPRKYENLVWKNLYFGRRRKNVIWLRQFSRFQKPTHIIPRNISPQLLQWIDEHIYMPRNIVKYLTEISSMMESQE